MAAKPNTRVTKIYQTIFEKYCNEYNQQRPIEAKWKDFTSQIQVEFKM